MVTGYRNTRRRVREALARRSDGQCRRNGFERDGGRNSLNVSLRNSWRGNAGEAQNQFDQAAKPSGPWSMLRGTRPRPRGGMVGPASTVVPPIGGEMAQRAPDCGWSDGWRL